MKIYIIILFFIGLAVLSKAEETSVDKCFRDCNIQRLICGKKCQDSEQSLQKCVDENCSDDQENNNCQDKCKKTLSSEYQEIMECYSKCEDIANEFKNQQQAEENQISVQNFTNAEKLDSLNICLHQRCSYYIDICYSMTICAKQANAFWNCIHDGKVYQNKKITYDTDKNLFIDCEQRLNKPRRELNQYMECNYGCYAQAENITVEQIKENFKNQQLKTENNQSPIQNAAEQNQDQGSVNIKQVESEDNSVPSKTPTNQAQYEGEQSKQFVSKQYKNEKQLNEQHSQKQIKNQ